jgi:hypothetical protein
VWDKLVLLSLLIFCRVDAVFASIGTEVIKDNLSKKLILIHKPADKLELISNKESVPSITTFFAQNPDTAKTNHTS